MKNKFVLLISLIVVFFAGVFIYTNRESTSDEDRNSISVNNFEECSVSGGLVAESYPRKCSFEGRTFVEEIGNELEKQDIIQIATPRPNEQISSPLKITGKARGNWYFESTFPVKIYDSEGKLLGSAVAKTQGDWTTEDFVGFTANLDFDAPNYQKGKLVLEKENPSSLPENADYLEVPVTFR